MSLTIRSTARLNNGVEIPLLGLGVFRAAAGEETQRAVRDALALGYRHVDTAAVYGNERDVGIALRDSGVPREEVFVTTKLWNADHGYDATLRACDASLSRLGLAYVDLYLMHWPVAGLRLESWRAMDALLEQGKARAIGVSNFTIRHLDELLAASPRVPAVNQVEYHPFLHQRALAEYCAARGIVVEAYSPLTKGRRLGDPRLGAVAAHSGKTPAQVLVRWALQHGLVVLPKSTHRARIEENAAVFDFEISPQDMALLDGLDENLRTSWDPTDAP